MPLNSEFTGTKMQYSERNFYYSESIFDYSKSIGSTSLLSAAQQVGDCRSASKVVRFRFAYCFFICSTLLQISTKAHLAESQVCYDQNTCHDKWQTINQGINKRHLAYIQEQIHRQVYAQETCKYTILERYRLFCQLDASVAMVANGSIVGASVNVFKASL